MFFFNLTEGMKMCKALNRFMKIKIFVCLIALLMFTGCGGAGNGSSSLSSGTGTTTGTGGTGGSTPPPPPPVVGVLAWNPPTNTAGFDFTEVAWYKVYYGTSSGSYFSSINVGNVTSVDTFNLPAGTYYMAVKAYDMAGRESDFSAEVIKIIN